MHVMDHRPKLRPKAVTAGLALAIFIFSTAAAASKPQAADDDWTWPAIIVGVMVFLVLSNLIFGKGSVGGDSGDGCGGGCGGGD